MTNVLDKLNFTGKTLYFIHIPKTAGCSFTSDQIINLAHGFNVPNIYRTPREKGGFYWYLTDRWGQYEYPDPNNYKITIIRNPFDLLCSYYFHGEELKPNGEYCHSGWACVNYTHQFKTFKEFIIAYCDPSFEWHQPAFKNFLYSQLFDINGNCVADIIVKYEYIDVAKEVLNKKLKHKLDVDTHLNKSNRKKNNYKEYYDDEMISLVNEKCQRELEHLNYDFNGSTRYEPIIIKPKIKYDVYNDILL